MEEQARHDIFEPGDQTALVCVDQPDVQQTVVDQLSAIDYKIHVGLFADDVSLKLRTYTYNVLIIDESFNGQTISTNGILYEAINLPISQRRSQFIVLVGNSMMTNDEMIAFIYSVDLVFNTNDLTNLKPVLRRAVARHKEFYHAFNEVLKTSSF